MLQMRFSRMITHCAHNEVCARNARAIVQTSFAIIISALCIGSTAISAAAAVVLVSAVQDVAAAVQRSILVGLLICVDVISEQGALPLIVEHNSQQASSCVSFLSMPSALLAPTGCSTFPDGEDDVGAVQCGLGRHRRQRHRAAAGGAGSSSNIICMGRMPSQQNV